MENATLADAILAYIDEESARIMRLKNRPGTPRMADSLEGGIIWLELIRRKIVELVVKKTPDAVQDAAPAESPGREAPALRLDTGEPQTLGALMAPFDKLQFKRIGKHELPVPSRKTPGSAGYDMAAVEMASIGPGLTHMVRLGFAVAIPPGYVGQLCVRSSLAKNKGIQVLNSPGIIDSDFRGEMMALLHNTGLITQKIDGGERIAQLVLAPVIAPESVEVDELDKTERGEGGWGSTNKTEVEKSGLPSNHLGAEHANGDRRWDLAPSPARAPTAPSEAVKPVDKTPPAGEFNQDGVDSGVLTFKPAGES